MGYVLRRVIFEDCWQRQTEELIALCTEANIKGVLLMEQSHMALMAPYTIEKHERMAVIYKQMAARLREHGISYGINIATVVGHTDSPLPREYILPFQKFVGDDLKEACACYCILDEAWQNYAAQVLKLYASTFPEQMFVDDDFRSLNHLKHFGCFCPVHMHAASQKLGRQVTGEEVIHAWKTSDKGAMKIRAAWQEANFEGQMAAAYKMSEAVKEVSPRTRVGLMSSDEFRHSLQGREIGKLLRAFAGEKDKLLYRPTGAVYGDAIHQSFFEGHQRMALTMEQLQEETRIVSELELFPHTRFTSSDRISRIMMKLQTLAGADDISLNLYDYLGNPIKREPVWQNMLIESAEEIESIKKARKGKSLKGFGLPYRLQEASKRTEPRGGAAGLYPHRPLDLLLPRMGIPVQFKEGQGNAILGTAVSCYTDTELLRLLHKGLLTDGEGAYRMQQRGFGQYLGCDVQSFGTEDIPAMEQIVSASYGGGFCGDYMPTQWFKYRAEEKECFYRLTPFAQAEVLTQYVDLDRKPFAPAMTLYHNSLGGSVAVFAGEADSFSWAFRSRAALMQHVIPVLMKEELPVTVVDCPDMGPIYYEDEDTKEGLAGIINASPDSYPLQIKVPAGRRLCPLSGQVGMETVAECLIEGLSVRFFTIR